MPKFEESLLPKRKADPERKRPCASSEKLAFKLSELFPGIIEEKERKEEEKERKEKEEQRIREPRIKELRELNEKNARIEEDWLELTKAGITYLSKAQQSKFDQLTRKLLSMHPINWGSGDEFRDDFEKWTKLGCIALEQLAHNKRNKEEKLKNKAEDFLQHHYTGPTPEHFRKYYVGPVIDAS